MTKSGNNLFSESILKIQHISTFDKKRIKKYIGKLDEPILKNLKQAIICNFKLV